MRPTIRWLLLLVALLVLLPTILSFGDGIRIGAVHHHRATATPGVFCAVLLAFFLISRNAREQLLALVSSYDSQASSFIRRFELAVICSLTLWLAFIKWMQSELLFTHVYDHGIFVNVLWNSTHGNWFWNSFKEMNFLGDHFSPFLALLSLPYFINTYEAWPLIAQTFAMMIAVWLVVRIASNMHPLRPAERLLLIFAIVCNEYFQNVHRFDMHPIAFGIPVTIAAYMLAIKKPIVFVAFLPFALFLIQEDVSLMIAGIAAYKVFAGPGRRSAALACILCLVGLWVNVKILIPYFGHAETAYIARYQSLGGNFNELIGTLFTRPHVPLEIVFSPSHLLPLGKLFLTWGFLPVLSPGSIALIPPILQHSLSDYYEQYAYRAHYSANLLPALMLSSVLFLSRRRIDYRRLLPLFLVLIGYSSFQNGQYLKAYGSESVKEVWHYAESLDRDVAVSVQGSIGIPFASRSHVHMYPKIDNAEVIVLAPRKGSWPLEKEVLLNHIQTLQTNEHWIQERNTELVIFRRKEGNAGFSRHRNSRALARAGG